MQRTIVKFDLVKSSMLAGLIGEASDVLARHTLKSNVVDLVRSALSHAGFPSATADAAFSLGDPWYKWEGDGAFLQFELAEAACKFALELQVLAAQRGSTQGPGAIRFRVGIATGPVTTIEVMNRLELEGDVLAVAARLEPMCAVGAVLIHESTRQALGNGWQRYVGQPMEISGKLHELPYRAYELARQSDGDGGLPRSDAEILDRIAERTGRTQGRSDWFQQLATELEGFPAFAPQLRRPIEVSGLVSWLRHAPLPELPTFFHALDGIDTPSEEGDRQLALDLLLLAAARHINFAQVGHPIAVGTDVNQHASFLTIPALSNVLAGVCSAARMGLQIHVGSHAAIAGAINVSVPRHRAEFDTLLLGELYPALLRRKFDPSDLGAATDSPEDRRERMERAWAEVKRPLDKLRRQGRFVALCLRFPDLDTPEQRELMLREVARACNNLVIGLQVREQGLVQGLPMGDLAMWIQDLLRRVAPDRQ